jgi:hypothetical protein
MEFGPVINEKNLRLHFVDELDREGGYHTTRALYRPGCSPSMSCVSGDPPSRPVSPLSAFNCCNNLDAFDVEDVADLLHHQRENEQLGRPVEIQVTTEVVIADVVLPPATHDLVTSHAQATYSSKMEALQAIQSFNVVSAQN